MLLDGSFCAQVAGCVPGVVDVGDDQTLSGIGGVDELAVNSRKGLIVTDIDHAWYANRYLGAKRVIQ